MINITLSATDDIIRAIAYDVLAYTRLVTCDPNNTYIPPSEEEVMDAYNHDHIFHYCIDTIAFHIFTILGKHKGKEDDNIDLFK